MQPTDPFNEAARAEREQLALFIWIYLWITLDLDDEARARHREILRRHLTAGTGAPKPSEPRPPGPKCGPRP